MRGLFWFAPETETKLSWVLRWLIKTGIVLPTSHFSGFRTAPIGLLKMPHPMMICSRC